MATRGRGRGGRMGGNKPKPVDQQSSERKPKPIKSLSELSEYLQSLNESNFLNYGQIFSDMAIEFAGTSSENMRATVDLIFDMTVESRDYVQLGAKVCQKIITLIPSDADLKRTQRSSFREALLTRFQSEYLKKEATRTTSIEAWLTIFSFLCEIFHCIRVNDQPVTVIGKAILSTMDWLLSLPDVIEDEIECICEKLKIIGPMLESASAEKTLQVFSSLRTKVISRMTSCRSRCIALEVIEYRAMGWEDKKNELESFYMDAIADATAEDDLS